MIQNVYSEVLSLRFFCDLGSVYVSNVVSLLPYIFCKRNVKLLVGFYKDSVFLCPLKSVHFTYPLVSKILCSSPCSSNF